MADLDYDHFDDGYSVPSGRNFGRMAQMGGAALSVVLILSAVVWGYKLAMRDVAGVPVFRAVAGSMRLAPAEPGGAQTLHQGLSVNAVAAAGTALPLPESLVLAPRAVDLSDEDLAGLTPLEPVGGAELATMAATPAPTEARQPEAAAAPEILPQTQVDAVAAALAEALGLAPESVDGGITRPQRRPGSVVASLEDVTPTFAPAAEVDPTTIVPGTLLVQLGAFDNQEDARVEWTRLSASFTDLMGGKALVIQPAQSGGRTFFRLRAHGFASDDETRRFCTAMLAENATCIPVAQR